VLLCGAGLSVLCEIVVFRRFRTANPATMMIASFALGFVIRYFLLMLFSSRPKSINLLPELSQPIEIFGARLPLLQLITIIVTMLILLGLTLFLRRTRFGLEMRAAAENFSMARMLGVRANRVIMGAFALSGALAGAIALIFGVQTGTADIQMGAAIMLMAFIATVIGGLGSLAGAVLAGFLLGAASVIMQVMLPIDARPFRDAFVYGAVILVLLFRPQGLISARGTKERV
jgi:branched-chain amino acid transport system permease protein